MILTRSPYYLNIPWEHPTNPTTPEKYIIQLFVWKGLKANEPVNPTYEIENKNPLNRSGNSDVNISNYINDILEVTLEKDTTTNLLDANSAVWVKSQVIYYINDVEQPPEYINIDLAIKGYGYAMEGKNASVPTSKLINSSNSYNINSNGYAIIPILVDELTQTDITAVSYPSNNLNKSYSVTSTTNSNELVKYLFIKCSEIGADTSVLIQRNSVNVCELVVKEELKYTPLDVCFVNKYGQLNTITFFKDKQDSLKVSNENYEASVGQASDGVHQFTRFNTNGRSEFKINTGWVKESFNESIKQLLLSNKVWTFDGTTFAPINVKQSNIEYQTKKRDKLLNYELSFEYAFNEINSI